MQNTFYHGDCKFVMEHDIEPNSIDLIYLDPPFFTGKVQKGTAKWNPAEMEVSYEDSRKFWGDTEKVKNMRNNAPDWMQHIALQRPDFASYLFYMMERLKLCHKTLKDTGSIYLHCDEKASHYLKMIMDELFGYNNFINELIWSYQGPGESKRKFKRKHDTIFFYSKSNQYYFDKESTQDNISEFSKSKYTQEDDNGKYKTYKHKDGNIYKQYIKNKMRMRDVWELPILNAMSKERVGYPTQKPLELLRRIINASSNKGDTILDPFCGCGTAIIAAQELGRNWIGIDISKDAYKISKERYHQLTFESTFGQSEPQYVERTLEDVLSINDPHEFERWVNQYFKADKPKPDNGIDGIIKKDNIPIQTKTYNITGKEVRDLLGAIKLHPLVNKPCNHAIIVTQKYIEDSARKQQHAIETNENIIVEILTPKMIFDKVYKNEKTT